MNFTNMRNCFATSALELVGQSSKETSTETIRTQCATTSISGRTQLGREYDSVEVCKRSLCRAPNGPRNSGHEYALSADYEFAFRASSTVAAIGRIVSTFVNLKSCFTFGLTPTTKTQKPKARHAM